MAKIFSLEVSASSKELLEQLKKSDLFVENCRKKVEEIRDKYKNEE